MTFEDIGDPELARLSALSATMWLGVDGVYSDEILNRDLRVTDGPMGMATACCRQENEVKECRKTERERGPRGRCTL